MFDCLLPELLYLDGQQLGIADSEVKNCALDIAVHGGAEVFFFFSLSLLTPALLLWKCVTFFFFQIHVYTC